MLRNMYAEENATAASGHMYSLRKLRSCMMLLFSELFMQAPPFQVDPVHFQAEASGRQLTCIVKG